MYICVIKRRKGSFILNVLWCLKYNVGHDPIKQENTKYFENCFDPHHKTTYIRISFLLWCIEKCKVHDSKELSLNQPHPYPSPPPNRNRKWWYILITFEIHITKHYLLSLFVSLHIECCKVYAPLETPWLSKMEIIKFFI